MKERQGKRQWAYELFYHVFVKKSNTGKVTEKSLIWTYSTVRLMEVRVGLPAWSDRVVALNPIVIVLELVHGCSFCGWRLRNFFEGLHSLFGERYAIRDCPKGRIRWSKICVLPNVFCKGIQFLMEHWVDALLACNSRADARVAHTGPAFPSRVLIWVRLHEKTLQNHFHFYQNVFIL